MQKAFFTFLAISFVLLVLVHTREANTVNDIMPKVEVGHMLLTLLIPFSWMVDWTLTLDI